MTQYEVTGEFRARLNVGREGLRETGQARRVFAAGSYFFAVRSDSLAYVHGRTQRDDGHPDAIHPEESSRTNAVIAPISTRNSSGGGNETNIPTSKPESEGTRVRFWVRAQKAVGVEYHGSLEDGRVVAELVDVRNDP